MRKAVFGRTGWIVCLLLWGCGTIAPPELGTNVSSSKNTPSGSASRSQTLLASGIDYLEKGDLDKAQTVFNSALKFDLMNPLLHFFNALTYQLKYERGEAESLELADIGFKNAISLDNNLDVAYIQLGKLYFSAKRYEDASKAFALATYNHPNQSNEPLLGLIESSMLSGDLDTAAWGINHLESNHINDPRLFRAKVFLAALAKQPQIAKKSIAKFAATHTDLKDRNALRSRMDQLLGLETTPYAAPFTTEAAHIPMAQAKTQATTTSSKGKDDVDDKNAALTSDTRKNWFRCDPRPAPVSEKDTPTLIPISALPVSDETATGITLPAPCTGERPPTAMIEVTLIRAEETLTKSYGVNLLDGLSLGRSVVQAADGTVSRTGSLFNTLGADATTTPVGVLPATTGYLSYSLNIANAMYTKNEVIARPSLAAVDRLPAVFFTGSNLSIKVAGNSGGVSQLVDKSVGLSLSITPTFLDNDEVMLNIRASRSGLLLNPDASNIALNLTRDSVNAVALVKFGQTFVLNGLVSTTKSQENSGVPILGDIPVLQMLFKTSMESDVNRQILTLITVRKLNETNDPVASAKTSKPAPVAHKLLDQVQQYVALQAFLSAKENKTEMSDILKGIQQNPMSYKYLSARDLVTAPMNSKKSLQQTIASVRESYAF